MGAVLKEKGENTRRKIMEAAAKLFRKHGIDEVSVVSIMSEIGLTPGGFYRYFPSKDKLASDVCALTFQRFQEAWRKVFEAAKSGEDGRLESLAKGYFALIRKGGCPVVTLGPDAADGTLKAFSESYKTGTKDLLELLTASASEAGIERDRALVTFTSLLGIGLLNTVFDSEEWLLESEEALQRQLRVLPALALSGADEKLSSA